MDASPTLRPGAPPLLSFLPRAPALPAPPGQGPGPGSSQPGLSVSLPFPLASPGRFGGAGVVTGPPSPAHLAACFLWGGHVSSRQPSLRVRTVQPSPPSPWPSPPWRKKRNRKTKPRGKVQRMTGTQREPGGGQKRETKKEVQDRALEKNLSKRKGKRKRTQGKNGERPQREAHSPPLPLAWAEGRSRPPPPTSPWDRGQGPAASVSQSREAATYTLPGPGTGPRPLPALSRPPDWVVPECHPSPIPAPVSMAFQSFLSWARPNNVSSSLLGTLESSSPALLSQSLSPP